MNADHAPVDAAPAARANVVAAFYRFVDFPDHADWREPLTVGAADVLGTILLAPEGINGTVAGPPAEVEALLGLLTADPRFADMPVKRSWVDRVPFRRLKVRGKSEIVTMGRPVDIEQTGRRVAPGDWDQLIARPDVLVVDTRNHYEVAQGSFAGAIDPDTESFGDFPSWAEATLDPERPIAMFCTGGIRCEKASAYLKERGFAEVYQLDGGILNYLAETDGSESWWGECYVFDRRVTVTPDLSPGDKSTCVNCDRVLSRTDRELDGYDAGVACGACADTITPARRARFTERQRQLVPPSRPESSGRAPE